MKTKRYQCRKCPHNFTVGPRQLTTADLKIHCDELMDVTEAIQWASPEHKRTDAELAWAMRWCERHTITVYFEQGRVQLRQFTKHLCTASDLADGVKQCIETLGMEE